MGNCIKKMKKSQRKEKITDQESSADVFFQGIKEMKSSQTKETWGEMIPELLLLIADHLLFHDYLAFRGVCRSWRNVATKEYFSNTRSKQPPILMLAEKDDDKRSGLCGFYSLTTDEVQQVPLPEISNKWCFETLGWLVMVDTITLNMELFHPLSKTHVALPHKSTFHDPPGDSYHSVIHKAVLSTSPSFTDNYILVVLYGQKSQLAFWRPGNQRWNHFETNICFTDILYYKNRFHAINTNGRVNVLDFDLDRSIGVVKLSVVLNLEPKRPSLSYLVESAGALFSVSRMVCAVAWSSFKDFETASFIIHEVDMDQLVSKRINDLGSRSIFLGSNASYSVDTCNFLAVKPNCIYYTDSLLGSYLTGLPLNAPGGDIGIYSMADGECYCKDPSVNFTCPPIWVTRSF